MHAIGSGLGLPFKKKLLPVDKVEKDEPATNFILALANVLAEEKIYTSCIQYMTLDSARMHWHKDLDCYSDAKAAVF